MTSLVLHKCPIHSDSVSPAHRTAGWFCAEVLYGTEPLMNFMTKMEWFLLWVGIENLIRLEI